MNFKEIQLIGFKSFADKTNIKFDDGVTCIVGPNGCGKSNVSDAVRWVLGERSAKNMRGSNMMDVIFSGTEERRALSYCEVTLVFDNTEKMFDIEYDEVAMTRRLYRSGESEYLLNKQKCRLNDIVALLHGVGIGKEGYSIIGQGKVEQIMNAKPEDRRAIFEEATGVMMFKGQKADIERKLESAKDDRTVFIQRMDEAEKQLKPLAKQAETAIKYREYTEQLRYHEVNGFLFRCENASIETEKFATRMKRAEERLAVIEQEIATIEREESEARERVDTVDAELSNKHGRLLQYEVGLEHKSGEAKVINEKIRSFRAQLHTATEDVDYSSRRIGEIDKLTAESNKKIERFQKRLQDVREEQDKLSKSLAEADGKIVVYEQLFNEKRRSQMTSTENLSELREATGSISARREALNERIEEVKSARQKTDARIAEYEGSLAECREKKGAVEAFLDGAEEQDDKLSMTITSLTEEGEKLSRAHMEASASLANWQHSLRVQQTLKNKFEGYRAEVRDLQVAAQSDMDLGSRILGTVADIVRTEQKYEVALETAFGGAMQNIVTATADDASYLIDYLTRTRRGVVTFLPADTMKPHYNSRDIERALQERGSIGLAEELVTYDPSYENIIKNLLGNTLICDNIDNAKNIAIKYRHAFRIVTLDGGVIATSGAMTGGKRTGSRASGEMLAVERRIKECEEGIANAEKKIKELASAIEKNRLALEQTRQKREELRQKVQEETANRAGLAQQELAFLGLLEDAIRDRAEFEGLLKEFERRAENIESEATITAESEDVLNRIRKEAEAELNAKQAEYDLLREERSKLQERSQALLMESTELSASINSEMENVRRMADEKEKLIKKIDDIRKKMVETQAQIEHLKAEEERAALTEEEQKTVASLRARIAEIEAEKRTLNERRMELAENKRLMLAEQQKCTDEKYKCENEITRIETSLENLKQRIEEQYKLTYETALALRDAEYDIVQSASEINSLRHKIGALGPVNMNAEEDYGALSERYELMLKQKEDLDKGIEDLETALDELKTAMKAKFDAGFNEINENFTRIFRELFGGGKAEMKLDYTDCEDPLNAGVEIEACPPGKRLTKISLLSGGERAFTAIAILFAILKTRPMPFCILDEIEAALDEANVDRFAKYLKKFSKDTQFIVITHRKPTMNQADTLFGVTMEEKGVSKIVSVKLSEVESKLGGDTVQ